MRWQVERVNTESAVASSAVMRGLPAVDAPVHTARRKKDNTQRLVPRHAPRLVVKSPPEDLSYMFINQIALDGLWRWSKILLSRIERRS